MDNHKKEKINLFDIEMLMYFLFIIAACIDLYANEQTRNLYQKNQPLNEEIRQEYILANWLIFIVFITFMIRNYYNLQQLSKESIEYQIAQIRLIGSILIVVGEALVLYYFYSSTIFDSN